MQWRQRSFFYADSDFGDDGGEPRFKDFFKSLKLCVAFAFSPSRSAFQTGKMGKCVIPAHANFALPLSKPMLPCQNALPGSRAMFVRRLFVDCFMGSIVGLPVMVSTKDSTGDAISLPVLSPTRDAACSMDFVAPINILYYIFILL